MTFYSDWLAVYEAAGRRHVIDEPITRGKAWKIRVPIAGDFSADAFSAVLATAPDGTSETNNISVDVGAFTGGKTTLTLLLNASQTAGFPADADGDEVVQAYWGIYHTPLGEDEYLAVVGTVPVAGRLDNV